MVHAWLPKRRSPIETEFHLTSIFFNMDSALECFTFALNSLGFVAAPKWFRDITDDKVLSKVYPTDIIGKLNTNPEDPPYAGYSRIFPTLQTHWQANKKLISHITEQHDVSKHRKAICHGGKARSDPPPGFYEGLGIGDDPSQQSEYWAMAEIIFQKNPKGANVNGKPLAAGDQMLLEPLAVRFCEFINESSAKVLHDTRTKINLPHKALIK